MEAECHFHSLIYKIQRKIYITDKWIQGFHKPRVWLWLFPHGRPGIFSSSSGEKRKNLLPAETFKKLKRCPAGAASVAHLRGKIIDSSRRDEELQLGQNATELPIQKWHIRILWENTKLLQTFRLGWWCASLVLWAFSTWSLEFDFSLLRNSNYSITGGWYSWPAAEFIVQQTWRVWDKATCEKGIV